MPRYIAEHTLPWTEEDLNQMLAEGLPPLPEGMAWKSTFCSFPEHKFFCEWEAPNQESIEQVFQAQQMPFDRVYPVRLFDVASKTLEP